MATSGEKKFVIKHTFKNVKWSEVMMRTYEGDRESHFGVQWRIRICPVPASQDTISISLDCLKPIGTSPWKITIETSGKIGENGENMHLAHQKQSYPYSGAVRYSLSDFNQFLDNGNLTIELDVKITEMSGIEIPRLRNFDDDRAKEHSDVMLKIGDREFYVCKMYLSLHSDYFKTLFSENFDGSEISDKLKDIDPDDMQKFLEVLYGEEAIDDYSVFGILKLAVMFDSNAVTQRSQQFFIFKSEHSLREKFYAALKYNMEELKKNCFTNMKTVNDFYSILPGTPGEFDAELWEKLALKALTIPNMSTPRPPGLF